MGFLYTTNQNGSNEIHEGRIALLVFAFIIVFWLYGTWASPAISRYQKRAEARNNIQVTELNIQNTKQQVEVTKQSAAVRVADAQGIAESQHIIDSSLTGNYLQYLAIQAQEKMASSPNHTEIYVPSGQNGIPLVFGANGNGGK